MLIYPLSARLSLVQAQPQSKIAKESFDFKAVGFKIKCEFKECIWNKINLKDSDKLLIGCVYKSTSSDTNNYSKLSEMLHEIGKLEDKFSHVLVT